MKRRTCVKLGLLSTGAILSGLGPILGVSANADMETSDKGNGFRSIQANLGIELYLVRSILQQDFEGTLKKLAEIGYKEVELFGFGQTIFVDDPLFGYSPREMKQLLEDFGFGLHSVMYSGAADDLAKVAVTANELGASYLIEGMAGEFIERRPEGPIVSGVTGIDQVKRIADRLNAFGDICRKNSIGFAYHNHHMEFVPMEDQLAYDIILQETDPELVKMELDVGWAKVAGADSAGYIERYPGRFVACHFKDFNPGLPPSENFPIPEMTQLVAPGDGTVDYAKIMAAMDRTGVEHAYVEVDLTDVPLELAQRAFTYLRSLAYSA